MKSAVRDKDGAVLVPCVEVAAGFWSRFAGLMLRPPLGPGRGLHISPCGSIHTFFMRFCLDVVFLDREGKVVRIVYGIRPNRVVAGGRGARSVLEMETGWLQRGALNEGDGVSLTPPVTPR